MIYSAFLDQVNPVGGVTLTFQFTPQVPLIVKRFLAYCVIERPVGAGLDYIFFPARFDFSSLGLVNPFFVLPGLQLFPGNGFSSDNFTYHVSNEVQPQWVDFGPLSCIPGLLYGVNLTTNQSAFVATDLCRLRVFIDYEYLEGQSKTVVVDLEKTDFEVTNKKKGVTFFNPE